MTPAKQCQRRPLLTAPDVAAAVAGLVLVLGLAIYYRNDDPVCETQNLTEGRWTFLVAWIAYVGPLIWSFFGRSKLSRFEGWIAVPGGAVTIAVTWAFAIAASCARGGDPALLGITAVLANTAVNVIVNLIVSQRENRACAAGLVG